MIHISEIQREPHRWIFSGDGYRELPRYGNRHVKFIPNRPGYLTVHVDTHNPFKIPDGLINHLSLWLHEKTGVNEQVLRGVGWGALIYLGIRALK